MQGLFTKAYCKVVTKRSKQFFLNSQLVVARELKLRATTVPQRWQSLQTRWSPLFERCDDIFNTPIPPVSSSSSSSSSSSTPDMSQWWKPRPLFGTEVSRFDACGLGSSLRQRRRRGDVGLETSSVISTWKLMTGKWFWSNYSDLTPNGGLVREIPFFQGNLDWWNIIIWPDDSFPSEIRHVFRGAMLVFWGEYHGS